MPQLPLKDAQYIVQAMEEAYRDGYRPSSVSGTQPSAMVEVSKRTGIPRTTLHDRLSAAKKLHGLEADTSVWRDPNYREYERIHAPATKPRVKVSYATEEEPQGKIHRVLAIGDTHDSPDIPDKSRFKWMGRHAHETEPDTIVQIGDFGTFDSVTWHQPNDTWQGKHKPIWGDDMESLWGALHAFNEGLDGYAPERIITEGNHEYRIDRFEDAHPEVFGQLRGQFEDAVTDSGWKNIPYGEFHFIGGVGFIHCPKGETGKEYGGKTAEQRVGNDAIFDIVFGHSHKDRMHKAPKIGPSKYIRVLNIGCALPWGHVEDYAKHSTTGWSYGVYDLTIQGGHIRTWRFLDMLELEELYD